MHMNGESGPIRPQAHGAGSCAQGDQDGQGGEGATRDALVALAKEKNEIWERYLRTAADLENLRKRQKREMDDVRLESTSGVLKEILPVADSLERVITHAADQPGTHPIIEGVQLVLRQFLTALERLDVAQIEAEGKLFNPNLHEAISQQETDGPSGVVVQVLQCGYKFGDRLLRPALVVVTKGLERNN